MRLTNFGRNWKLDRRMEGPGSNDKVAQKSTEDLGQMVRSWVHFDNLAATFVRQGQQARSARARWEQMILDNLQRTNMTNAIIQNITIQTNQTK